MGARFFLVWGFLFFSINGYAWEKHQVLMPWVVKSLKLSDLTKLETLKASPDHLAAITLQEVFSNLVKIEGGRKLASNELKLNPRASFPVLHVQYAKDIFLAQSVDEPDHGMDRNLEDSADPSGDRNYTGGTAGPTSQGFRHLYFGGWKLAHPIATFQIPMRSLGQSPDRVKAFADEALSLLQSKNYYWGFRVLNWSMHYLQDLTQPFHSVQVPTLSMIPWLEVFGGFHNLVKESTRTVSNYHFAYEDYVYFNLSQKEKSIFNDCLTQAEKYGTLHPGFEKMAPLELAHEVANRSIELAPEVGAANMQFFGNEMMLPAYDIPNHKGVVDYAFLFVDPKKETTRKRLEKVTCHALANAVLSSRALIEWELAKI